MKHKITFREDDQAFQIYSGGCKVDAVPIGEREKILAFYATQDSCKVGEINGWSDRLAEDLQAACKSMLLREAQYDEAAAINGLDDEEARADRIEQETERENELWDAGADARYQDELVQMARADQVTV